MTPAFTVPDVAREMLAQVRRDHPESLPHILRWLADIEEAKPYLAEHPAPPPPPLSELDYLHLSALRTWMALSQGRPAPALDTEYLYQLIYTQFRDRDGQSQVDRLCEQWLSAAREYGLAVEYGDGNLLPGVLDATTHTVSEAIWFGLTQGHVTMTGGAYHVPRRLLSLGHGTMF